MVWGFANTQYAEEKVYKEYVGGSQGISVRIMEGVYYRTGGYRGHTVEEECLTIIDTGELILTDKNVYFVGPKRSLRIPYSKIISYRPYRDGVDITRDTANAKAQTFITGDGPFTYSLLINLSRLAVAGNNQQTQPKAKLDP
jgi:hypothetical protein